VSVAILVFSILLMLAAIATSLRLVRTTRRGLPWLLLSAALVLMTVRRLLALVQADRVPPDPYQETTALAIAGLLLLAVRAQGRFISEVGRLRDERATAVAVHATLLANVPMAVIVVEPDGTVRFLNPDRFQAVTGYDPDAGRGLEFWLGQVHDDDRRETVTALESARNGSAASVLVRYRHGNGQWHWASTLLYSVGGGTVNALMRDVTEQQQLEERLHHLQKMDALGTMTGGLAHDFNNVLGSVIGHVELALRRLEQTHPARAKLEDAVKAAQRASTHARQLLAFSRREVLHPRAVGLGDICREAVALVKPSLDPRIIFRVDTDPELWDTRGDAGELVQVLVNLFLNARDAMPGGGELRVETTNIVLDETYARVHPEGRTGEFVRLLVADTGLGMTDEVRSRIFEPFFTTKPAGQGTGLGLAMVYGTIRRHGGWIQCYSEPGRGTRLSICLPRCPESLPQARPNHQLAEIPTGSETILLVDDDEDLRTVGVESLIELGYSVVTARDGVEALAVYRERHDRIRLVILDLSMPRMDGRDALIGLREIDPGVRVLMTSGHSDDASARDLVKLGALGFVAKPYRLAEIGRAVRAALDPPHASPKTA
jgi:PAS domain S-box-containing protein